MTTPIVALSVSDQVEKLGAYAGFAAVVGLAVLALLYFASARELKRLREWADRAPERVADLEARIGELARQRAAVPQPVGKAVAAKPGAKPATAAAAAAAQPAAKAAAAKAAAEAAAKKPAAQVGDTQEVDAEPATDGDGAPPPSDLTEIQKPPPKPVAP